MTQAAKPDPLDGSTHELRCEPVGQIVAEGSEIDTGQPEFVAVSGVPVLHEGPTPKGREMQMDRIGVYDVSLDEPLPEAEGEVEEDAGPQWLKVLLWESNRPPQQVWVTCQAEEQPEGALWVGPAPAPARKAPRLRVVPGGPSIGQPPVVEPPKPESPRLPAGIVMTPEGIGALAATGATLLTATQGMETLVDRIVLAAVHGVLRVLRSDARLVRELVGVVRDRGAPAEVVAMAPEAFAARWGFKRRIIYRLIQDGLPTTGEGKRRRIPVVEGDAWMNAKATSRIEQNARQAAAAVARQQTKGNGSGHGMAS